MPVPPNYRWLFQDPEANLPDYRVPINPNKMSTPYPPKNVDTLYGINGRNRTRYQASSTHEWSFSGVIREQDHHDKLLEFARCQNDITITDHLGRVWSVMPVRFVPDEKRPSARKPYKFTYEFVVWVLGGPT
jgi:hypothetical protein